jgi:hypothetical protein
MCFCVRCKVIQRDINMKRYLSELVHLERKREYAFETLELGFSAKLFVHHFEFT